MDLRPASYIQAFSYPGIFLWFAAIEQLTPIPEEVSLMTTGYLSMHTSLNPWLSGGTALLGLLAVDNLFFFLSSRGSNWTKKMIEKISPDLKEKLEEGVKNHQNKTLFLTSLIPKLRFFCPLIAGASDISLKRFITVNGAATLLYTTFYFAIGVFFHRQMNLIFRKLSIWQNVIFGVFMVILTVFIIVRARKFYLQKEEAV